MDWDISPKFDMRVDFDLSNWAKSRKNENRSRNAMPWSPSWKSLWRHNAAVGGPISIKFRRLTHRVMAMMMRKWKSKPEVEFQHGRRLFQEIGNTNVSTLDWDKSSSADEIPERDGDVSSHGYLFTTELRHTCSDTCTPKYLWSNAYISNGRSFTKSAFVSCYYTLSVFLE